jgi:Cd2+/Zn2+-exporting ATPase
VPGEAVWARLADGTEAAVGSPRYARRPGIQRGGRHPLDPALAARIDALEADGRTVVVVLLDGQAIGALGLGDEIRPDAAAGIARLRALGIRPTMLTGDNHRAAAAIAAELGIPFQAELLPDAKLAAIAALRARGPVGMIGDGINDAPALAAASVGVAMGGGTDVALETADAVLLRERVCGVAELVALAAATLANIRQNLALALGLKALFLTTTLFGATTLWMAVLADTGATVLVTANALRLLRFRFAPAAALPGGRGSEP